jgi:hypothetical protein
MVTSLLALLAATGWCPVDRRPRTGSRPSAAGTPSAFCLLGCAIKLDQFRACGDRSCAHAFPCPHRAPALALRGRFSRMRGAGNGRFSP